MPVKDRAHLTRAWLQQLLREYRQICWRYKLNLDEPVFEVTQSVQRAGAWEPACKTIKLASWLIEDYAWDVVLEVLKHEMAHQYVHQYMEQQQDPPHGPAFLEACERLGVHPEFRCSTAGIPRLLIKSAQPQANKGILAKVEKLFSLAQSGNEHEAAQAMQKGNALLRKHNLERIKQAGDGDCDYLVINPRKKRLPAQDRSIAALLNEFFYVNVVICQQFDAASADTFRVIELTGAKENLAVAEYVYHFLSSRLPVLWQRYKAANNAVAKERKSYFLGVLHGFQHKLRLQEEQAAADGQPAGSAMICAGDPGLIRFYTLRYPRLKSRRHQASQVYVDSYKAGQKQGRQLVLHKGIAKASSFRGDLLTSS